MPTPDLAAVTRTIQALLQRRVAESTGKPANITLGSPECSTGENLALNLFLYHVSQDPSFRGVPVPRSDADAVQAALALRLFYILTAHQDSGAGDDPDGLEYQTLFGHALKVLYDMPLIRAGIADADDILDPSLGGIAELTIVPHFLSPENEILFWLAGRSHKALLSAYYEVRFRAL